MKGIISGIKRMEIHDGDGLRTTVFFKGCPLKCIWCHNPESISIKPQVAYFKHKCIGCKSCLNTCENNAITAQPNGFFTNTTKCKTCFNCVDVCPTLARIAFGEEYDVASLANELLEDKDFFIASGGGVTFSGGECLAQPQFAIELAKQLYCENISVDIDTCGYVATNIIEELLPYVDVFLYDIKAMNTDLHKKLTGKDNDIILKNLTYLLENNAKVEIRFPLVMGYNDCETNKIGEFLSSFKNPPKIKVLQYHSYSESRYEALNQVCTLPNTTTTVQDVDNAVSILKSFGLDAINGATKD